MSSKHLPSQQTRKANIMNRLNQAIVTALAITLMLQACSMAPAMKTPEVPVANSYKETPAWMAGTDGMVAKPADELPRGAWWKVYRDAELDALEERLVANNPDLAAAVAHYAQAEAFSRQLRSSLFPSLDGTANAQRLRQSENRPLRSATSPNEYNDYSIGVQASYEVDLWGRVSNLVKSGKATAQAEKADLESTRLSLQAQLAQNYIALRGIDQQVALLGDTVAAYRKALDLTKVRHDNGIAPGLDVARAETQYQTAQSQVEQSLAQRALAEHAIAALVGASVSEFSIASRVDEIAVPSIPLGVPSTLLQRRPDIASAQRRVESANASVGVAKAAFFPSLTLGGALGFESASASNWLTAPSTFWAIGPSVLLNLFDAGKRKAQVAQAQAVLDETGANYRGVVIGAFQQVEDNLALINHYSKAAESQQSAAAAAKQSEDFSISRYRQGAASYLEVTASQTAALQTQRDLLDLNTRRLQASVQLIRALGGGWADPS
jgi:NodT family efflux transporter outer membrane factor (OMF) lipoprotein